MNKKKNHNLNNQGISLVEVIIVLAIMAIIGGALFLSTSVATDKHVTSCAEKIASAIEQTRNLAMGKQGAYIEIWKDTGDTVYLQMYVEGQPYGDLVNVGHAGLTIEVTYKQNTGVTYTNPIGDAAHKLKIVFNRSNGSVEYDGSYAPHIIDVTNGRREIKVTIDAFTGRVSTTRVS